MSKSFNSEQERFWAKTYSAEYMRANSEFDHELGASAWRSMLAKTGLAIDSYLECGCNIGRNIQQLEAVIPMARRAIIEISEPAFKYVTSRYKIGRAFHGPILDSRFAAGSFELVFTMGVLIHIQPVQLVANMMKMYNYSSRYVLMGEYFSRTPVVLEYHGEKERLFKRDFGKLFMESFNVKLVDYGFLWGHLYDSAGFDDITWWLFEKS
jgi:pseudaminic acid biosynthesis-associated methylase